MSLLSSEAIKFARVWLGDENSISWTDDVLFAKLQVAHRELLLELRVNSVPVIKTQTTRITVGQLSTDLVAAGLQPSDMVQPLMLKEADVNADIASFVDMIQVTFLPTVDQGSSLVYWAWQKERIMFVGSTSDRDIIIRYKSTIVSPQTKTDSIGFIMGELYLGPRTAAICRESRGLDAKSLNDQANKALYKIIQANVVEDQRPVRRRKYRSPKSLGTFGGGVSVPIGNIPGGTSVSWLLPQNIPDGLVTAFRFSVRPRFCTFNGVIQFEGAGYTVSYNSGTHTWNVILVDVNGNTITPNVGDEIRAEVN